LSWRRVLGRRLETLAGKHGKYAGGLSLLAAIIILWGMMFDASLEYAALYTYALAGILLAAAMVLALKNLR